MDKAEYKQMCESHGLRLVSDFRAVGMERGYPVTVQYAGKKSVSMSLPTGKEDQKRFSGELKSRLRESFGKSVSAAWADVGYVTVYLDTASIPDVYCQGVTAVLDIFKSLGFTVPDRCAVCGGSGCDCATPRGPAYAPVHRACLESGVAGAKAAADKNIQGGSYLLGAVGAFLGAAVGVLPSVFTILALEKIYVLLFMLIPLASYAGYKLLKGKMNYASLVFTLIFSVLAVYLLNFGITIYYLADYYELTASEALSLVPPALGDPEMWVDITRSEDFLKCILFVALGIFLAWGQISRTNKTSIKDAQGLLESAVPYGAPNAEDTVSEPSDSASKDGNTSLE